MDGGPSIQEREDLSQSLIPDEDGGSGCYYSLCHPKGRLHRFVALFFMCFIGFGSYFCYDNPAALETHLERDLNITTTQYSLLYSLYSWPNTVFCFIGGFLLDRVFGIRAGTNIYMCLTLLGQLLFACATYYSLFWGMLVGRLLFGIGAESLAVAQNNYTVLWFKGKELNMVFGLQLCLARIGSTVNFAVMEYIYKWVHKSYQGAQCLGVVLLIATLTCVFSMFCSVIIGLLDKRAERILRRNENTNQHVIQLKDFKNFKLDFVLLTTICVFYYVAIFPFISFGQKFYMTRFHFNEHDANFITSLVYLSGAVSPLLGYLVDLTGTNLLWMLGAIVGTMAAHNMLGFTCIDPYVGTCLMGVSYACLASGFWPLVSLVVPEYQLGTAYGICQAVQNCGLAIFAIVAGTIVDKYGYKYLEAFFLLTLGVALLATILLWIYDFFGNGLLNLTPAARRNHPSAQTSEDQQTILSPEDDIINEDGPPEPSSDFHIRNRYLSRIGASLPDHYNIASKGLRTLR